MGPPFGKGLLERLRVFIFKRTPPKAPSDNFIRWCTEFFREAPAKVFSFNDFFNDLPQVKQDDDWAKLATDEVTRLLTLGGTFNVNIDKDLPEGSYTIDGVEASFTNFIETLKITAVIPSDFHFNNVSISHLIIYTKDANSYINTHNANIGKMEIRNSTQQHQLSVSIGNSNVGMIGLSENSISYFSVIRSAVMDFECPPTYGVNPFSGSVIFMKTYFPKNSTTLPSHRAQSFRNLRHHLMQLQNMHMANLIHSVELILERNVEDSPFNKFLSYLYQFVSDFGSSTSRPLMLLVLLWVLSIWVIVEGNGAVLVFPEDNLAYRGWRELLVDDFWGNIYRSITLSSQQTFNPLGLLKTRNLVLASSGWYSVWGILQGILSTTFIALFILAVRRRFKLQ